MTVLVELFIFALFIVQWAGVLTGVSAEMVILVTYLLGVHAGTATESNLTKSARVAERAGLMAIVASGIAIVAFHTALGQAEILFAPAFVGKWVLVGIVLVGYKFEKWFDAHKAVGATLVHGIIGGTWVGILLIHMLAPETTALTIVAGYVLWMFMFGVTWAAFVMGVSPKPEPEPVVVEHEQEKEEYIPAPKPVIAVPKIVIPVSASVQAAAPAPVKVSPLTPAAVQLSTPPPQPAPKHIDPAPAPQHISPAPAPTHNDAAPAPHKPIAAPAPTPVKAQPTPAPKSGLSSIQIMPRTEQEVREYSHL